MKTKRQKLVYQSVEKLYQSSERELGKWMWENHVQWVAEKASKLASKYGADEEKVFVGALLHDLGDVWMERDAEDFETRSNKEGEQILKTAGFNEQEIDDVLKNIVEPHSCYPGHLPETAEGKCLASADAMFHLMTDFFPQFGWKHLPNSKNYDEWIFWVIEKIERDFNTKVFFEDERKEVEPFYLSLKTVYAKNK